MRNLEKLYSSKYEEYFYYYTFNELMFSIPESFYLEYKLPINMIIRYNNLKSDWTKFKCKFRHWWNRNFKYKQFKHPTDEVIDGIKTILAQIDKNSVEIEQYYPIKVDLIDRHPEVMRKVTLDEMRLTIKNEILNNLLKLV